VRTDVGGRGLDDTDRDADRVQVAILRTLSVSRRLAQVDQLFELTTALALADLRRLHPDATPHELRRALVERLRLGAPSATSVEA